MRRMRMGRDAAPAGPASSAGLPGGLGAPPYRHYDRCAGSLLNGRTVSGSQARPEVSGEVKRPHQNAAVKRRKARRLASSAGGP